MADKKYPVHYANFVCHFGADELLDYLQEIVVPAFTSSGVRTFKDGRYFFDSVRILDVASRGDASELAICGRFVKDMVIRSEQRWDPDVQALVPDAQRLETAPSSIFVLLLASHKLIYLLETSSAPGLESFRSTAANFLASARRDYINDVHMRANVGLLTEEEATKFLERSEDGAPEKVTKTRLNELVGPVDLDVVALSNEESLRKFLDRFRILQSVTVRLVKPNSEIDNDDFLGIIRTKSDAVRSRNSSLTYRNTEGLIKSKVLDQLEVAAAEANTEIKLEGKDATGQGLKGSNDQFKVISYLGSKPIDFATTVGRMFALFKSQRQSGLIKPSEGALSDSAKERLTALSAQLDGRDGRP